MRVLLIIPWPAFGGAHNQALRLSGPLGRRGVRTLVLLPDDAQAAAERLRAAGVEVATMPLGRLRATPDPLLQAHFVAGLGGEQRRLQSLITDRGIDVVQVHGVTNPQGALAARREGRAVVWQLFDTRAPMPLRRLGMPIVKRLADELTVWGEGLVRAHPGADALAARTTIVYPPVEQAAFRTDPELRRSVRAELGLADSTPLVGTVGLLNPQKGHEHLIRAASIVRRQIPAARFLVIGASSPAHGSYEDDLRTEARDLGLSGALSFVDPGTRVPELMQALDLFAMTSVSRSEGMPTAILEAMACAKPVVATRVGAVDELVEDGRSGLLVPPASPSAVAGAIARVLEDDELRSSLGARGRALATERFPLEGLADLHAGAYARAAERARARRRASGAS